MEEEFKDTLILFLSDHGLHIYIYGFDIFYIERALPALFAKLPSSMYKNETIKKNFENN